MRCFLILAAWRAIYFFRALCSFQFFARPRSFPAKTANAERTRIWVSRILWQSQYALLFVLGGLASSRAICFFRALCSFKFLARTRFFLAKTAKTERTQIWVSSILWQSQYALLFDLGGLACNLFLPRSLLLPILCETSVFSRKDSKCGKNANLGKQNSVAVAVCAAFCSWRFGVFACNLFLPRSLLFQIPCEN